MDSIAVQVLQSVKFQAPLGVLVLTALLVLIADVLLPKTQRRLLPLIGMLGVVAAFVALHVYGSVTQIETFFGGLRSNYMIFLVQNLLLAIGGFVILISPRYINSRQIPQGEYYALLIFAIAGMLGLAASTELLSLFLHVELVSIALYILAGIEKRNLRSTEAAFKYFLLGSFAAAFLLLGIAFVFGGTGQTRYDRIFDVMKNNALLNPHLLAIGIALMMVGFAFKLTLAPFHMYAPDLYEGAPTPVAALVATGLKVAAFSAFFSFIELAASWVNLPLSVWMALYAIAVASMVIGNFGALVQPNFKRMLAYSSISHSAYTLIPVVVLLNRNYPMLANVREAVIFYLLAYTIMTLLAFGVASSLGSLGEGPISRYAGLGRRQPMLALIMTLALLSLIGIPPTVGFFGKFRLITVAIDGQHYWLAIIAVLTSVASAFYYLRVIVTMYMKEVESDAPAVEQLDGVNYLALTLCTIALFFFAFIPSAFLFGSLSQR
jgi:NADH-quinone oxidoreductase subunit N